MLLKIDLTSRRTKHIYPRDRRLWLGPDHQKDLPLQQTGLLFDQQNLLASLPLPLFLLTYKQNNILCRVFRYHNSGQVCSVLA
jgi:hypothetical protein